MGPVTLVLSQSEPCHEIFYYGTIVNYDTSSLQGQPNNGGLDCKETQYLVLLFGDRWLTSGVFFCTKLCFSQIELMLSGRKTASFVCY